MAVVERETFGSVLNRLGGIPPERVLLHPVPGTATVEDVIAARLGQRKRLYELIDGVLVEKKAVSFKEGILAGEILTEIRIYLRKHPLGFVTPGDSQIEFRIGLVRIPDVSYIPWSRIPGRKVSEAPIGESIPALTVEVLSPSNTPREIDRKLREYFEAGVKIAWVIDPRSETARVYTSAAKFKELSIDGTLEGGRVLPGFKLPMRTLFAVLEKPDEAME